MVSQNGDKAPNTNEKASSEVLDLVEHSVIDRPKAPSGTSPAPSYGFDSTLFYFIATALDEIEPWGTPRFKLRDRQLRNYVTQEPIFASALGIICSRNAGFRWKLDGPRRTVSALQYKLETVEVGRGWQSLITKTVIDLSTQDTGSFWEIIRQERGNPESPFETINHLDAARCWHTGDPEEPVIYLDRRGKYHKLRWYEVIQFSEMASPVETFWGLQYSALTRMLTKWRVRHNMDIYDDEKSSGRNPLSINLLKGITTQQLDDAINRAQAMADNRGMRRHMTPINVGALDPTSDVGHDTIDLKGVPEGFEREQDFKEYINLIAMAFESDYQEFAPLPGGGLGTGAQSEMLHLKSRGKGPATFMKLITYAINFLLMPQNVRFFFDEEDLEAERGKAQVQAIRAQTRAVRIASGEITTEVARQIAQDVGDLDYDYLQLMWEQDVTADVVIDNASRPDSQLGTGDVKPGVPGPQDPVGLITPRGPANIKPTSGNEPARVPYLMLPSRASAQSRQTTQRGGASIPSIRPPTPLGPKGPLNSRGRRLKELLEDKKNYDEDGVLLPEKLLEVFEEEK